MRVVEMQLSDGTQIWVEVDDRSVVDLSLQQAATPVAATRVPRFGDVGKQIAQVCAEVRTELTTLSSGVKPDEVTLEFGLKIGGKRGIPFVAEGSAEATFKVTAKWK